MLAINGGKGERATLLIRAGADVTKVNAAGLSAFHIAAAKPALIQLKQLAQKIWIGRPKIVKVGRRKI